MGVGVASQLDSREGSSCLVDEKVGMRSSGLKETRDAPMLFARRRKGSRSTKRNRGVWVATVSAGSLGKRRLSLHDRLKYGGTQILRHRGTCALYRIMCHQFPPAVLHDDQVNCCHKNIPILCSMKSFLLFTLFFHYEFISSKNHQNRTQPFL